MTLASELRLIGVEAIRKKANKSLQRTLIKKKAEQAAALEARKLNARKKANAKLKLIRERERIERELRLKQIELKKKRIINKFLSYVLVRSWLPSKCINLSDLSFLSSDEINACRKIGFSFEDNGLIVNKANKLLKELNFSVEKFNTIIEESHPRSFIASNFYQIKSLTPRDVLDHEIDFSDFINKIESHENYLIAENKNLINRVNADIASVNRIASKSNGRVDEIVKSATVLAPRITEFMSLFETYKLSHSNEVLKNVPEFRVMNRDELFRSKLYSFKISQLVLKDMQLSCLLNFQYEIIIPSVVAMIRIANGADADEAIIQAFSGTDYEDEMCQKINIKLKLGSLLNEKKQALNYLGDPNLIIVKKAIEKVIKRQKDLVEFINDNYGDWSFNKFKFIETYRFHFSENKSILNSLAQECKLSSEIIFMSSTKGKSECRRFESYLKKVTRLRRLSFTFSLTIDSGSTVLKSADVDEFKFGLDLKNLIAILKNIDFNCELLEQRGGSKLRLKW